MRKFEQWFNSIRSKRSNLFQSTNTAYRARAASWRIKSYAGKEEIVFNFNYLIVIPQFFRLDTNRRYHHEYAHCRFLQAATQVRNINERPNPQHSIDWWKTYCQKPELKGHGIDAVMILLTNFDWYVYWSYWSQRYPKPGVIISRCWWL